MSYFTVDTGQICKIISSGQFKRANINNISDHLNIYTGHTRLALELNHGIRSLRWVTFEYEGKSQTYCAEKADTRQTELGLTLSIEVHHS